MSHVFINARLERSFVILKTPFPEHGNFPFTARPRNVVKIKIYTFFDVKTVEF